MNEIGVKFLKFPWGIYRFLLHIIGTVSAMFRWGRLIRAPILFILFLTCTSGGSQLVNFVGVSVNRVSELVLAVPYPVWANKIDYSSKVAPEVDAKFSPPQWTRLLQPTDVVVENGELKPTHRLSNNLQFRMKILVLLLLMGVAVTSYQDTMMLATGRSEGRVVWEFRRRGRKIFGWRIDAVDEISAAFLLLVIFVHNTIELVIGYGSGSRWASDYVIVIFGAWLYQSAPEWGRLAREENQSSNNKRQRKKAVKWVKEKFSTMVPFPKEE